ncbi:sporulation YhaL family protein [Virgibacillus sp. 179-BFC.A HS]|uniref:Sporulation YhaL family protein n=1 Tax=Tigheibacillus jepli TaxID=3035914 RepID=A0ABU5CJ45_9BACI|nr:sporulation YhaL family protein [Virgibacillus sp. 179-BFC.A HS]MDY0406250.1 sporulation YhaL family protein [Virgibacillus sp. 179-BFC.A HS]
MILGMPWWIFFIVLLIFLSGYMAFRAMRAEKQLEQQFIEREGNIYIQRMEEEKQRKTDKQHREISG